MFYYRYNYICNIIYHATYYFGRILKSSADKTAAVRPLASHLTNHPSRTNKICGALLEKLG